MMIGILFILMLTAPILSAVSIEKKQTFFLTTSTITSGMQPPIQWEKTYGSPSPGSSYFVQQTNDGGYIATGVIFLTGGADPEVFLVKTDSAGNQIWSQTYGGATPFDCGYCVQQTNDGGYIIAGIYHGYGLWLIKTDANGTQQWNQIFTSLTIDTAYSVQQTTDNGFVLVGGYTYAPGPPDVWVIKTDSVGNLQWDKKLGGGATDYGRDIRQTSDGGYIVVGYTNSFGAGQDDVYLLKLDGSGNIIWSKTFGGNNNDHGNSVRQTSDGGYILTGYTWSFGAGQADIYVLKTDSSGNTIWTQTYGGVADDEGNSIRQTPDGGYILCGTTQSYGSGGVDVYLIKLNSSGVKEWDDTYGGTGNEDGQCVDPTSDGYYIIAGTKFTSYNEFWLIKLGIPINQPPNKPAKPNGSLSGKIGVTYTYNTTTSDPEGDNIYFWFDWGDGTSSGWVGPYISGALGNASHSWTIKGTYTIKVKAKDTAGNESVWSDPLPVTMPCSYNIPLQWFWERLFQRFPNAFPILRHLMGY